MLNDLSEKMPKFYGSVTVGERGQIAIPAEARREMQLEAGTKLVVLGSHEKKNTNNVKSRSSNRNPGAHYCPAVSVRAGS